MTVCSHTTLVILMADSICLLKMAQLLMHPGTLS